MTKMSVTRQVISDLWPVYASGEASDDTRALVESYLSGDPEFAKVLRDSSTATPAGAAVPALPPDHELQALARTKRRLRGPIWLLWLAMMFTMMAFGRIVSDTSWDVSPRTFIVMASLATVCWIAFFVHLLWTRRRLSITSGRSL